MLAAKERQDDSHGEKDDKRRIRLEEKKRQQNLGKDADLDPELRQISNEGRRVGWVYRYRVRQKLDHLKRQRAGERIDFWHFILQLVTISFQCTAFLSIWKRWRSKARASQKHPRRKSRQRQNSNQWKRDQRRRSQMSVGGIDTACRRCAMHKKNAVDQKVKSQPMNQSWILSYPGFNQKTEQSDGNIGK